LRVPILEEISIYTQRKHIPFSGHISEYISPVRAAQIGQKSFEHLNRIEELYSDGNPVDDIKNTSKIALVIRAGKVLTAPHKK
jgi:hypothetical protein